MAEAGFYGVAAVGALVGEGVTGSRFATLDGVVKINDEAFYQVANEYICGLLGLAVGLPVPPGTIARMDDGAYCYVMLRFGLKGDKPPPADTLALVADRPMLAARIVVFDCLIMNGDRHPKNFAYIPGESAAVFDHGHALLGTESGAAMSRLDSIGSAPMWQGSIAPELKSAKDLYAAASLIRSISDDLVVEACDTPRRLGLISADEAKKVDGVLRARKKSLTHYIESSTAAFPKVTDWGLSS